MDAAFSDHSFQVSDPRGNLSQELTSTILEHSAFPQLGQAATGQESIIRSEAALTLEKQPRRFNWNLLFTQLFLFILFQTQTKYLIISQKSLVGGNQFIQRQNMKSSPQ